MLFILYPQKAILMRHHLTNIVQVKRGLTLPHFKQISPPRVKCGTCGDSNPWIKLAYIYTLILYIDLDLAM